MHHTRIAATALLLRPAGGGLSRICDNDDAADDLLVVQSGDVRAISRSLPVLAARALEPDPEKCAAVFPRDKRGTRLREDHAQTINQSATTIHPTSSRFRRVARHQVCPINLRNAAAPSCIASRP